ncbi:MAG: amino acid--tRNA ligase-related protein [Acidobacteriota bacterium]
MSGCSNVDRRFPIHRTSAERWLRATQVNLAADRAAGFSLAGQNLLDTRPDLAEFGEFVNQASPAELEDYARAHRHESLAFLVLMLTGACDADCAICFTDRRKKRGETSPEARRQLLREAAELGAQFVYVPGEGEPTLDAGWWEFLDAVREFGLHAVVFTNSLAFGDDAVARKRWGISSQQALERLLDYPVSFYNKLWSFDQKSMADMLCIAPSRVPYRRWQGMNLPTGLAAMLDVLPRERVGIEVVIERRNAREVIDDIAPFSDEHDLCRIIEIIQHNGRTLGKAEYDPSAQEVFEATKLLSVTSCVMATCKAVVTARGMVSPRIAILEHQIPEPVNIAEGSLWQLIHSTPYIVDRRYQLQCLCELEPAQLASESDQIQVRPGSVAPAELVAQETAASQSPAPNPSSARPAESRSIASHRYALPDLLSGVVPAGTAARVVGRVHQRNGKGWSLQDGPHTITVRGSAPPPHHWVEVEGTTSTSGALIQRSAARTLGAGGAGTGRNLPERSFLQQPQRLQRVVERAHALRFVRATLDNDGFLEVTTPFLQSAAENCQVAQATVELGEGPEAKQTAFLRTDPEEYLKRYLTAGLEAVYEISTNVRDEAPDGTHLREFQSLEYYHRGWSFADTVSYAETLVRSLWRAAAEHPTTPFQRLSVREAILDATGLDLDSSPLATAEGLRRAILAAGLEGEGQQPGDLISSVPEALQPWRRSWVEALLDAFVCPHFTSPTWLVGYPPELALSSRVDAGRALRGELFAPGGLELAHVYENEVLPGVLKHRYSNRHAHRVDAGLDPRQPNEDLFASLQLGMPPMAGGAIGVDRVLMIARGEAQVGSGLLFPHETGVPLSATEAAEEAAEVDEATGSSDESALESPQGSRPPAAPSHAHSSSAGGRAGER